MVEKRPYRMSRRAERVEATRRRIVQAAVALHSELGIVRTTISAVAERAGVQRLTVYSHFPDETTMVLACRSHWIAANPLPDMGGWAPISDPVARLRYALDEWYRYLDGTEDMIGGLLRDEEVSELVSFAMTPYHGYVAQAVDILADGWLDSARSRAAIGLALSFHTWRTLMRREGLPRDVAVDLMVRLVHLASTTTDKQPGDLDVAHSSVDRRRHPERARP
jgi:AcrR family transcriptional regulator